MLGELVVIVTILITVAFVYVKSTIIKAFLLLINALVAATVAFAYFETLGSLIISRAIVVQWALVASFVLIFALTLLILNVISGKLALVDISYNKPVDNLAKCLLAAFAGFVIAGVVLIAAAMAPISSKLPYERFNTTGIITHSDTPKSLILNADGFVTSFVSWLSRGSMSGRKSLAAFHPDLLNEIHLNRIAYDKDNIPVAGSKAISVKNVWVSKTELLSASDNQPMSTPSGKKAVIARTSIYGRLIKDDGALTEDGTVTFTMSQLRLLCRESDSANSLDGSSEVIYPAGLLSGTNTVDHKNLSDKIALSREDMPTGTKLFDFLFYIPTDTVGVMMQFKQNVVIPVGKMVSGEDIPEPL